MGEQVGGRLRHDRPALVGPGRPAQDEAEATADALAPDLVAGLRIPLRRLYPGRLGIAVGDRRGRAGRLRAAPSLQRGKTTVSTSPRAVNVAKASASRPARNASSARSSSASGSDVSGTAAGSGTGSGSAGTAAGSGPGAGSTGTAALDGRASGASRAKALRGSARRRARRGSGRTGGSCRCARRTAPPPLARCGPGLRPARRPGRRRRGAARSRRRAPEAASRRSTSAAEAANSISAYGDGARSSQSRCRSTISSPRASLPVSAQNSMCVADRRQVGQVAAHAPGTPGGARRAPAPSRPVRRYGTSSSVRIDLRLLGAGEPAGQHRLGERHRVLVAARSPQVIHLRSSGRSRRSRKFSSRGAAHQRSYHPRPRRRRRRAGRPACRYA